MLWSGLADESSAACLLLLIGALSFCCCFLFPSPFISAPLRVVHVLSKPRNGIHRSSERAKKKTESTCIDKLKAAQMFAIALTCLTTMEWYYVRGRGKGVAVRGCGLKPLTNAIAYRNWKTRTKSQLRREPLRVVNSLYLSPSYSTGHLHWFQLICLLFCCHCPVPVLRDCNWYLAWPGPALLCLAPNAVADSNSSRIWVRVFVLGTWRESSVFSCDGGIM